MIPSELRYFTKLQDSLITITWGENAMVISVKMKDCGDFKQP